MKKTKIGLICISSLFIACSSDSDGNGDTSTNNGNTNTGKNQIITEGLADFKNVMVPPSPGDGMKWEYDDSVSDDFNYDFNSSSRTEFGPKSQWTNWYHNDWKGPGLTIWDEDNVLVKDGNLTLITTRIEGETKKYGKGLSGKATRLGCVSSNKQIVFPVYIEARLKVPNTVNASGAWLLSPDDTQEIDFMEAWGGEYDRNTGNGDGSGRELWENIHLSHHIFIRKPFKDYQPKDETTWYTRTGVEAWNDGYHRYGVFWKSPTELFYYIDGRLVKTTIGLNSTSTKHGIDPLGYTAAELKDPNDPNKGAKLDEEGNFIIDLSKRTGLNKPMDILIDMEDQDWRAALGATPTDAEIANTEDHTYKIDWIRIYNAVEK